MKYYFLGIGGIGMSAQARFFNQMGHQVFGYDRTPSPLTAQLEAEGITIHYTDDPSLIPSDIDVAIYTPAVPSSTAEFQYLQQLGIPFNKRSQMLGELTRGKKCIAIAGTHGKTTTSSLVAHLLSQTEQGCSAFLGGIAKNFDSNLVINKTSPYVVVEADEYDRSFLQLHPYVSVITSTDPDHLDIYGTHENMLQAFAQFASQTDDDGLLILKEGLLGTNNHNHEENGICHCHEQGPLSNVKTPHTTYTARGVEADYYAINVRCNKGDIYFDLRTPKKVFYDLQLCQSPLYNVENAVAASAAALACGITEEQLRKGLKSFTGIRRRFDYHINRPDLVYIDDYAHHPQELQATIESIRYLYPGKRVVGIFQPHLYSRTADHADGFAQVLSQLDETILMPIYPAREEPIPGVSSELILHKMSSINRYLCSPQQVLELLPALYPDVVVTLGAGDIDRLVPQIEVLLK